MIEGVRAKSILNRSAIGDYCINPYIGCQHACVYCYADYYTRLRGYDKPWGSYIYVKMNALDLLLGEIAKKRRGVVYLSSLTDPYQRVEERYRLTRRILEVLMRNQWPVILQTKSPLVLRDLDIIKEFKRIEVGFTIITLDEDIRGMFEPHAPPTSARIEALKELREEGIKTFVFIGPILPGTKIDDLEDLVLTVKDYSDVIYFDRLNLKPGLFDRINRVFLRMGQPNWSSDLKDYYQEIKRALMEFLRERGVNHIFVY